MSRLEEAVRLLLEDARAEGASDVHLNPTPTGLRLRYRVDGRLRTIREIPDTLAEVLPEALARLREAGTRATRMESALGPNVVLRLQDIRAVPRRLEDLGMRPETLQRWRDLLKAPGLLVITGPTGSGKTTTAYATLAEAGGPESNTMTVEDPVECLFDWAVQIPVREDLDFPAALRGVFLQDPDVVFCSEVREAETARLLCQLALTGHLVLTCLHAPDAAGAVQRLDPLPGALKAVLSQRLVRRLCGECRGAGCEPCAGTGHRGRVAVFHLEGEPGGLKAEALRLVEEGVTTESEAARLD